MSVPVPALENLVVNHVEANSVWPGGFFKKADGTWWGYGASNSFNNYTSDEISYRRYSFDPIKVAGY